jgi:uncharacterized membrane protein YccC
MKTLNILTLLVLTPSFALASEPVNSGTLIMISSVSGWLIACGGAMLWRNYRKSRLAKKSDQ